ncbi:uncharacterized protein QC763_502520 [Podospora pseudopauciseta]|uniref:Uncharacterized protein n=1 Tax=Podospora pseudopauciseta TaxID=2093780 RepID=A0ABR0H704_9PEZI|nr:hypothetical protein QC763_502520 [Podospora pseudopauciseta]
MPFFKRYHFSHHHHHHRSSPPGDQEMSDFQHHPGHSRINSGKSSSASSNSGYDLDDDAITPCPLLETTTSHQTHRSHLRDLQPIHHRLSPNQHKYGSLSRTSSQKRPASRSESWRTSQPRPFHGYVGDYDEEEEGLDTEILWKQMLAVQDRFGCYNSARMRAALEGGDTSIPSKICLDLINDSIGEMPEDARQRIELFLEREGSGAMVRRGKWKKFWHRVIYV